jgi:hypothetical protein
METRDDENEAQAQAETQAPQGRKEGVLMPTLSTAARDAACNGIVDLIDGGTGAGNFLLTDTDGGGGSTLAEITLNATAFGASSTGTATLDVSGGLSASASGTGTAAGFALRTGTADTVVVSGSVGTGSEDVTIDNTSVTNGQTVNLNAITITVPAS